MTRRAVPTAAILDPMTNHLAEFGAASPRVVVLSGAGMSTDSGIPDFHRGPQRFGLDGGMSSGAPAAAHPT
jgi:hypothetical protein